MKRNRSSIRGAIREKRTKSTVEFRGTTTAETIFSKDFNRANFDSSVVSETREVIAGKIQVLLACVDEFRPGSDCTRNYEYRGKFSLLFWGEGDTWSSGVHSSTSS